MNPEPPKRSIQQSLRDQVSYYYLDLPGSVRIDLLKAANKIDRLELENADLKNQLQKADAEERRREEAGRKAGMTRLPPVKTGADQLVLTITWSTT